MSWVTDAAAASSSPLAATASTGLPSSAPSSRPRVPLPPLSFLSIIMKVPAVARVVPTSLSRRLLVSPKSAMEMRTAMSVLDLSIGTTLLTSPAASALK